jgi:hypothetical protein
MAARPDTNARVHRQVDCDAWSLAASLGERVDRLHNVPTAPELLATVVSEAELATRDEKLKVNWQDSYERPGFGRISCLIPLSEQTFDQLFNGRSGYRAQYYLSPEEGVLFNHSLLVGLTSSILETYQRTPLAAPWDLLCQSLLSPHSKIWVLGEQKAFDEAADETLNPPRWVANKATRGRKAPLPAHLTLDLNGAFLHPKSRELFVDDLKLDRPHDLFMRGYT